MVLIIRAYLNRCMKEYITTSIKDGKIDIKEIEEMVIKKEIIKTAAHKK